MNPEADFTGMDFTDIDGRQLFDYQEDPRETVNMAGYPEYAEAEAGLRDALHQWLESLD